MPHIMTRQEYKEIHRQYRIERHIFRCTGFTPSCFPDYLGSKLDGHFRDAIAHKGNYPQTILPGEIWADRMNPVRKDGWKVGIENRISRYYWQYNRPDVYQSASFKRLQYDAEYFRMTERNKE